MFCWRATTKIKHFLLCFVALLVVTDVTAAPKRRKPKVPLKVLLERFQENASSYDALSLRVLLKKIAKRQLNFRQWNEIRRYLIMNPQVGYDLIYKWEKIRPAEPNERPEELAINEAIDKADQLAIEEKFNEAFKIYQKTALMLKVEVKKGRKENLFLYSVMLHSMGRSLFGAARYDDALEVYRWLPKNYPRIRQVLYEKMWAAFRSGRIDVALGAIASQESSYFSSYLEPETYLIKTYIFKKLCRDDDLKDLRKQIQNLKSRIEKGDKKFYREWATSDIELLSLSRLTLLDPDDDTSDEVTKGDREREVQVIKRILQKKFAVDIMRLQRDLTNILAYSNIALGSKDFSFVRHEDIDHTKLMERGDEVWAVNDAEDWVDEIGGHLFIGDSLCKPQAAAPKETK
jgi:hypothetical protein